MVSLSIRSRSSSLVALILLGLFTSQVALPNDAAPVHIAVVTEQAIQQTVLLTGTVTAARSASLSTSTAGLVQRLHVDTGSAVEEGELLLELDAELAQWEWQGSQASVEAAQLALADAQRRLNEAGELAPKQSIAETVVRALEAEVAGDKAELQRARAEASYRKGVFERHQLRAPFTGVVSEKLTELGEWVTPGQSVLELVSTEALRMDFQISEDFLSAVGPDTNVSYTLGESVNDSRAGKVAVLVPVADPSARTFLLRVVPEVHDERMSPGISARAALTLTSGRRGVAIPRDAIIKYPDGRVVVWLVEPGDKGDVVVQKRVETGLVFDGMVEILSGLATGARVVVEGNESLRPGQRVSVLPARQG